MHHLHLLESLTPYYYIWYNPEWMGCMVYLLDFLESGAFCPVDIRGNKDYNGRWVICLCKNFGLSVVFFFFSWLLGYWSWRSWPPENLAQGLAVYVESLGFNLYRKMKELISNVCKGGSRKRVDALTIEWQRQAGKTVLLALTFHYLGHSQKVLSTPSKHLPLSVNQWINTDKTAQRCVS